MEISINHEEFSLNSRVFFAKLKEFFAKLKEFFAKLNFSAICGTQGGGKALKKQACNRKKVLRTRPKFFRVKRNGEFIDW